MEGFKIKVDQDWINENCQGLQVDSGWTGNFKPWKSPEEFQMDQDLIST